MQKRLDKLQGLWYNGNGAQKKKRLKKIKYFNKSN